MNSLYTSLLLAVLGICAYSSAWADEHHGKRIYLRAWSLEDALDDEAFDEPHDSWERPEAPPMQPPQIMNKTQEAPPKPPIMNKTQEAPPKPPIQNKTSDFWSRELVEETPDLLPLTIHHEDGSKMSGMLLQRNFDIEHPMEIQMGEKDLVESIVPEGAAMYHDTLSGAMLAMQNENGKRHFDGSFHVDGARYEVHPDENDNGKRTRGFENHVAHVITRAKDVGKLDSELKAKLTTLDEKEVNERSSSTDYKVEMALIIDYSEYNKWNTLYTKRGQKVVLNKLKYKFGYMYHAMDRTLKTITQANDGYTIRLYIKKIHVITKQSDSAVKNKHNRNRDKIDPVEPWKALLEGTALLGDIANKWIGKHGYKIDSGKYDTVMYYHTYPMDGAVGWAYTGAVCDYWGVSNVADHGFEAWTTAVHELGHTLGADHDGNSRACPDSRLDVMTNYWGKWSGVFSSCSKRDMKKTLARKRCLDASAPNDVNPNYKLKYIPNADWQCKWKYSKKWWKDSASPPVKKIRHCHEISTASDCVYGIECGGDRKDGTGLYCRRTGSSYQPADGTTCGNGKQCMQGDCVTA